MSRTCFSLDLFLGKASPHAGGRDKRRPHLTVPTGAGRPRGYKYTLLDNLLATSRALVCPLLYNISFAGSTRIGGGVSLRP